MQFIDVIDMIGTTSNLSLIQQRLHETAARHAMASHNIANVNTPGFKAKEIVFANSLSDSEDGNVEMSVQAQNGTNTRLDGNNVDINVEIGQLTKNSLAHNAYTQILAAKVRQMQSAISGSA